MIKHAKCIRDAETQMKRTKIERGDFLGNSRMFGEGNYKVRAEETLFSEVIYEQQEMEKVKESEGVLKQEEYVWAEKKKRRSGWAFVVRG